MTTIHNVSLGAWQRRFLIELFQVLLRMRGRVNFTNMARYSTFCEQTFRRHFQKAFRWIALNLTILRLRRHPSMTLIGVFRRDFCGCTFLPKTGTETWAIDHFFRGWDVKARARGLDSRRGSDGKPSVRH